MQRNMLWSVTSDALKDRLSADQDLVHGVEDTLVGIQNGKYRSESKGSLLWLADEKWWLTW